MKTVLRELGIIQIEEIKTMIRSIFSEEPWNDIWTEPQLHQYVLELMHNSNPLLLGLYEEENLIGISLGRIKHWCGGTEYWIDEFGVLPEKQRQGAGSEFLKGIKDLLTKRGIGGIVLLTERTAPAYHFYRKSGFQEKEEWAFLTYEDR